MTESDRRWQFVTGWELAWLGLTGLSESCVRKPHVDITPPPSVTSTPWCKPIGLISLSFYTHPMKSARLSEVIDDKHIKTWSSFRGCQMLHESGEWCLPAVKLSVPNPQLYPDSWPHISPDAHALSPTGVADILWTPSPGIISMKVNEAFAPGQYLRGDSVWFVVSRTPLTLWRTKRDYKHLPYFSALNDCTSTLAPPCIIIPLPHTVRRCSMLRGWCKASFQHPLSFPCTVNPDKLNQLTLNVGTVLRQCK